MNFLHTKFRTAIAVITVLALAACGGGGGGGGGSDSGGGNSPEQGVPGNVVNLSSAEGMTVNQTLSGQVTDVRQVQGSDQVTVTFNEASGNTTATFTIGQLENEENSRFEIFTDNNGTRTRNIINLSATNTSAVPLLAEARGLEALSAPQALLADDLRLANVALELEYLANLINATEQQAMRDTIDSSLANLNNQLAADLTAIANQLRGYESGDVTETALRNQLDQASARILSLSGDTGESILDTFTAILTRLDVVLPDDLNATHPLVFDDNLNRFTRFGAAAFGQPNGDGTFTFDGNLDFLNAVFTFARPAIATGTAR